MNTFKINIKEELHYAECSLYYESWQIQCCGDSFAVGDKVEWTGYIPESPGDAHGITIDFEEDHHGMSTHSISGTVSRIIAERSEFPKGKREIWYNKATTIQEDIRQADGWESEYNDDENADRTFWGYIVMLKDVTIKPLCS